MTVIAYRDGIMAADSLVCDTSGTRVGSATKISRSPAGHLAASSGSAAACYRFRQWIESDLVGAFNPKAPADEGFRAIVVYPDGSVWDMGPDGTLIPDIAPFYARGRGGCFALGAMQIGASAKKAVWAAIALETCCGGDVQVEKLNQGIQNV